MRKKKKIVEETVEHTAEEVLKKNVDESENAEKIQENCLKK